MDLAPEKRHGPQIKDPDRYERLREEGMSKQKAARISNAPEHKTAQKGGKAKTYEDQTKEQLYEKAKEVGIEGRSDMSKKELIDALRYRLGPILAR